MANKKKKRSRANVKSESSHPPKKKQKKEMNVIEPLSEEEEEEEEEDPLLIEHRWKRNNFQQWVNFFDTIDHSIRKTCPHHEPLTPRELKDNCYLEVPMTPALLKIGYDSMGRICIPTIKRKTSNGKIMNLTRIYEFYIEQFFCKGKKQKNVPVQALRKQKIMKVSKSQDGDLEIEGHEFSLVGDANIDAFLESPTIEKWKSNVTISSFVEDCQKRAALVLGHFKFLNEQGINTSFDKARTRLLTGWTEDNWKNFRGSIVLSVVDPTKLQVLVDSAVDNVGENEANLTKIARILRSNTKVELQDFFSKLKKTKSKKNKNDFITFSINAFKNIFYSYLKNM